MQSNAGSRRGDFVDEETIGRFVGKVEPGGEVSPAVALWSVALSIALALGSSLWWISTH
jgi:hypothetical protein